MDVLVEFQHGKTPGWEIVTLKDELIILLARVVDLRTSAELSHYFREQVLAEAILKNPTNFKY